MCTRTIQIANKSHLIAEIQMSERSLFKTVLFVGEKCVMTIPARVRGVREERKKDIQKLIRRVRRQPASIFKAV